MSAPQPVPVIIGGCAGWLHLPAHGRARNRGVVLCPPLGQEGVATHRGLWDLAQRCAAQGLPALRFDYPGTGDSLGAEAAGLLEGARLAIVQAAAWLRRHAGVAEVALCGLQLGALLAAQAAVRQPGGIAALALLAPVVSGRTQARQLRLMAEGREASDWLEVAGQRLHGMDLEDLSASQLGRALMLANVRRVLVVERRAGEAARLPFTALQNFQGAEAFLTHAHAARIPAAAFDRVAGWLAEGAPALAAPRLVPAPPVLRLPGGATERALRFGPGGTLAGVLCLPEGFRNPQPAALLLNTGANRHVGVGRLSVRLARHLAGIGVASLRMDGLGLGDSDAAPDRDPTAPPDLYASALTRDAACGLDLLLAEGTGRAMVVGLCSGAHHALQLALADARVDAVALFNLPAFDREAGAPPALDGGPPPREGMLLRRPHMLARRLRAELDRRVAESCGLELGLDRPGRWLRRLAGRDTEVLLAYSARDRGLRELRAHFGRNGRRLKALPQVHCVVLDGADHSVAPLAMQAQAVALVEAQARRLTRPAAPAADQAAEGWADLPNHPLHAR